MAKPEQQQIQAREESAPAKKYRYVRYDAKARKQVDVEYDSPRFIVAQSFYWEDQLISGTIDTPQVVKVREGALLPDCFRPEREGYNAPEKSYVDPRDPLPTGQSAILEVEEYKPPAADASESSLRPADTEVI